VGTGGKGGLGGPLGLPRRGLFTDIPRRRHMGSERIGKMEGGFRIFSRGGYPSHTWRKSFGFK